MPKANRTCYCCGQKYYYCPSCSRDHKDPLIFTMWDSALCKEIFTTLVNESTNKITTLECKKTLIELGVNKNSKLTDSVRKHVDRVMSCEEPVETISPQKNEDATDKVNDAAINVINENIKKKTRNRKN